MQKLFGFSLIEILVVMVVIGLLSLLTIPIYSNYLIYSNRTDAIQTLLAIQIAEEKYRLSNNTYGTLAQVWSGTNSVSSYYQLAITNVTATTYTITATATGNQTQDTQNGMSCASIVLAYASNTATKTPAACWAMN